MFFQLIHSIFKKKKEVFVMAIVIGDVAGQLDALKRLIAQFPKDKEIIFVGDLVDRGPMSPQVIDFCMENKYTCLRGNHEDMMIDFYEGTHRYDIGLWEYNGGTQTRKTYMELNMDPRDKHIPWLKTLPYYVIRDNYFISHAPIVTNKTPDQPGVEGDLMWNRNHPGTWIKGQKEKMVQVFGHNSHWGVKFFKANWEREDQAYAICIDASRKDMIAAYDTEMKRLYTERYIDFEQGDPEKNFLLKNKPDSFKFNY